MARRRRAWAPVVKFDDLRSAYEIEAKRHGIGSLRDSHGAEVTPIARMAWCLWYAGYRHGRKIHEKRRRLMRQQAAPQVD